MRHALANLALWGIAVATTLFAVRDAHATSIMLPVFGVCMIGSVIIVRAAGRRQVTWRPVSHALFAAGQRPRGSPTGGCACAA